ncbi:ABC transporter permease [Roseomonas sp. CECT 9278]|uniref:ABC transporter permease n=1 Tax=Roseomonas sp. CECT 9278 TaxID=2845823 RepID=UPI001E439A13|nr:ABC transporter permease [Roseomonas sp. CECT 9278]CAH0220231.1 Putrescine transport system permease protein PotH [Roseomonas sp. CECT 9278]
MTRRLLLAPVAAWLLVFVAAPAAILLAIALAEADPGVPPFRLALAAAGFSMLVADAYYLDALLSALGVAAMTALLCLALGYPMAIGIARAAPRRRVLLLAALMLPFWTGFLLRVGAWIGLLRDEGWINGMLRAAGIIEAPLPLLYTDGAMLAGMVHAYLPFAVLPLFAALLRLDPTLAEAAADLGARPPVVFLTVTLPATLPAATAGFLLVFIPAAGEFVIPELMGPPEAQLVGRVLWQEFFQNRDWPVAAALAVALLALLLVPIRLFQRIEARP